MPDIGFLGLRGTGDFVTDQRPKNWREQILRLYPNGKAPLTALLALMKNESTDDPEFNWWTKKVGTVNGTVTNIYTDVALATAYTSGGVVGTMLYVKIAAALAEQIRPGHQILLRDASHFDVDVNAKVIDRVVNGASSYLAVSLLEADDNGASTDLSDCDTLIVIGNINAEGSEVPESVTFDPTKFYNYTQIFRTPLEITRTAKKTKLRTKEAYQEAKMEALEMHSIEMEMALLWGIRTESTGSNGKPERTTQGMREFTLTNVAANVNDFSLNTDYSGDTWLASGETWFDSFLEQLFRYADEPMAFIGSGALQGLNRLAKNSGQINITPETTSFGLKVQNWITPFGTIVMKTHPLFSYDATTRNTMFLFEPKNIRYRYIDDTKYMEDPNKGKGGFNAIDGLKEEYITEMGVEFWHPDTFMILNGVGVDNDLS